MAGVSAQSVIETVWILTSLSLVFVITRCYVRLWKIRLPLNLSDYLVIISWIATLLVAIIYSILYVTDGFYPPDEYTATYIPDDELIIYQLKLQFASIIFNDIGLYGPKFSFIVLYYQWVSVDYPRLRIALYCITIYAGAAFLTDFLSDFFWCHPISQNWSLDFNTCHVFNDFVYFEVLWALNILADISIFTLPFFLLPHLKLQKRTFYGAMFVFLFGAITIITSTVRIIGFSEFTDVGSIYVVFQVELHTSIIVTCLPSLKVFLASSSPVRGLVSYVRELSSHDPKSEAETSSKSIIDSRRRSVGKVAADIEFHNILEA